MKRILIVNVNWVGDALFSTPAIRAIRKKYPDCYLACLAPLRVESILKNNPYLNEVITYTDRRSLITFSKISETLSRLREGRFDTAIFFHRSHTKVFIAWLAGIPRRIGFLASRQKWFLTDAYPAPEGRLHKTDYFLSLLERIGIPSNGRTPDFFPQGGAEEMLKGLLTKEGVGVGEPYVVVHAGGNWDLKRWPVEHFIEWIRLFRKEYPHKVLLCGTGSELALCEKIRSSFEAGAVISLCDKTTFDMLAVLLRNARMLLSNDSGPIHLAASQKTRILGLFGPTSPEETGPLSREPMLFARKNVGCEIPCYFRSCDYRICMDWLEPSKVFEKTKELLAL